jgi:hypothetical protein
MHAMQSHDNQCMVPPKYSIHTSEIIHAAKETTKFLTYPVPLLKYSQFVSCKITRAAVAQLSGWATLGLLNQDDDLKQWITLIMAALKTMREVWSSGRQVL